MKHFARIDWKPAALAALLAAGGSAACSESNDGPETPPGGEATPYVTQYSNTVPQWVSSSMSFPNTRRETHRRR